jgi:hypothetical protein
LFHLQALRFACRADAERSIMHKISKKLKYHQICGTQYIEHKVYDGKGRPKKGAKVKRLEWQVVVDIGESRAAITQAVEQKSCFILVINTNENELSSREVLTHYKAQFI